MKLCEAVTVIIIALLAITLITNPGFNSFMSSLIHNATKYLVGNYSTIKLPTILSGPCTSWGAVNITLTSDESIFLSVPNESYVYLLSSVQFHNWNGSTQPPSDYVWSTLSRGIYVVKPQTPGNYYLLICGNSGVIYRVLNYTAMGVAAYYGLGLSNISTNAVLGIFNITSVSILNSTGMPQPGFSLQLNAYVIVKYANGELIHWVQDALVVVNGQYWFQGEADVTNYIGSSQSVVYKNGMCVLGCFETPMVGALIISINSTKSGIVINYGYVLLKLGNETFSPRVHWFARQFIPIPNATAYIITSPAAGPYGWPMDTEFVIGGPGNGGGVQFRNLNATLSLYYWNGTSWNPYPITYTFGISTGEYAINVTSIPVGPSAVKLKVGNNNYEMINYND
ncbi:MAG: thermopsin family protease [Vulcanisaeta sp. AZ3]